MDELIDTLMSYEVEHMNKENNNKGKKIIAFRVDHDDATEQTSSEDEDDKDLALLTRKFENIMRK